MSDGAHESFRSAVKSVLDDPVWSQVHAGTVVTQHADGTVDALVDDKRIVQVTNATMRVGAPELRVVLQQGDRVSVAFEDGDPRKPIVWSVDLDPAASAGVSRVGDRVDCGALQLAVVAGQISGSYTSPFGTVTAITPGQPFALEGKIISGSSRVLLKV